MRERADRISKIIGREIANIISMEIDDAELHNVTITRVEMTGDLRMAKLYYVISAEKAETETVKRALLRHVKFIRKELAGRVSMRYAPEVSFREDILYEYRASIDTIFRKIEDERAR